MKTIMNFILSFLLVSFAMTVNAQGLTKAEMKLVKKEVKKYEKDGWKVKPGSLSLTEQISRSKRLMQEEDINGKEKWQIGVATSVGSIYDAARMQAMSLAKEELAGLITTSVTSKFLASAENRQLTQAEAESKVKVAMEAKGISIDQKLASPRVIFDAYRNLKNGNVEVIIRLAIQNQNIEKIADDILSAVTEK